MSSKYTRDSRQFTMTMHRLIGSKEPNIKLSIDSNTSIAANTFGNQACSNFTISDVNMCKQRRIKSNDTNRATRKRPNTMATLRDKSTILTVVRAPKYDKQTTISPINRIHARRRVNRRRRQKPLDVERTCRHPDQRGKLKVAISIEIKWRQHESIAPHARRTHRSTQQGDSINHTKLSCPFVA
jgi:hypothetical protein